MVRRREVSSVELVSLCLAQIAARNPRFQAFASVMERSARRSAAVKDGLVRQAAAGLLPPFWGLPMGIKDINFVRGARAGMGSRAFTWLWSPLDDVTVTALRQAGFVFVGKTATSELALMPVVAAGLLPVAQASDGAGSIRIPASFCGLIGHKPSRDLLANPYRHVDTLGMSTSGAITRTVEDAAAMLDMLAQRRPGAGGSFLDALGKPLPVLRVQFTTTAPIGMTAPAVDAAVRRVAAALSALGHEVTEVAPLAATLEEFLPIYQRLAANALVLRPRLLQPVTRWLRAGGRRYRFADMITLRNALAARMLGWCGDADIVLTPTVPILPPRVGALGGPEPGECFARAAVLGAFTAMCNLSGQPAISLPVAVQGGLPIGAQLIGRVSGDARLLTLAQQLVSALPPFPQPPPAAAG